MEDNQDKIDLTKYIDRFYKSFLRLRKFIFIIVVASIALFEIKELLFFNIVYSSHAVFIASTSDQENIYTQSDDNDNFVSSFNSVMTSNMMQKVIMNTLDVNTIPGTYSLSQVPETNLIELIVTSKDAKDAYNIADCIINNYSQVTDSTMSDVSISILDTPTLAESPDVLPDYLKTGVKGLILGLGISFVLTFVYMLLRHTIINTDDIKNYLHIHNMTKIPYISIRQSNHKKASHLLLSNPRIQYHFKQAFHDIRINIEQETKKNGLKTLMITSTLPNEGKTIVSTNTAISLADKGHKVVLLDLDLRNPSVYGMTKETKTTGNIVDYLKGKVTLNEIINKYQDYSLDIIYGFSSQNNATELLSTQKFRDLITYLKETYDYVILDVPPLYLMEDSLLIANECDSAIVVIKQDYSNTYDILESMEELNEHAPYILGTVLNQYKPTFFDQDESSHYGYGYGYGYGRK